MSILALACALAAGTTAFAPVLAQEPPAAGAGRQIPYKKADAATGAAAGQSILVLAVLLGVAWGGLVLARRYLPQLGLGLPSPLKPNAARRLKVLETMRLGPRASLYLVQFDHTTVLLAQSGDNMTVAAVESGSGGTDDKDHDVA